MNIFEFNSVDNALIGLGKEILQNGVTRKTRGFNCIELEGPTIVTITDPTDRFIKNPARKWNKTLPVVETLWMLNGVNDLKLPGTIVKNLYSFSDDGQFMRAGYGPRIRGFSGIKGDYLVSDPAHKQFFSGSGGTVDQLKYVVEALIKDPNSRQASITIHDPAKDCFIESKDIPCTRLLHFMKVNGRLDMTVYMRSNDLIWGLSAVNVWNFTMIQEIVAMLVGMPIGHYHHYAANLHIYDNMVDKLKDIVLQEQYPIEQPYYYQSLYKMDFDKFDAYLMRTFYKAEEMIVAYRNGNPYAFIESQVIGVDIFDDWLLQIHNWCIKGGDNFLFNNYKYIT